MSEGLANVLKIVGFILYPYLGFNDLLRLRRLCKWSKALAEDYLRLKASTQRCVRVSLNPKYRNNLSSFLDLSLTVPLCHVYIGNEHDGNQLWDMEEHVMSKFLALYGQRITHLTLRNLELPMGSEALGFFESLANLEHLEIDSVYLEVKEKDINGLALPSTFRKLKKLCIQNYSWNRGEQNTAHKRQVFIKFLEWCQPCLESIKHVNYFTRQSNNVPVEIFEPVRTTLIQVENPKLKIYDLNSCANWNSDDVAAGMDFYRLLTACYQNNVKLCNVHTELIELMSPRDTAAKKDFVKKLSDVIMSMYCDRPVCFWMEVPHLQAMEIGENFSGCSWMFPQKRMAWPNLKRLKIHMNRDDKAMSQIFFPNFFGEIRRENMELLDLEYGFHSTIIPFPNVLDIGKSCPNLKKLHLRSVPVNSLAICKLWEMLPLLEALEFEKCYGLTMEGLVGENRQEPSFFKLKNLHKLTLNSLGYTSLTDDLFVIVLRHMPLKELYLGSSDKHKNRPISQITVAGIKSLLTGVFAETIERFPLRNLKLKNVSKKEMSLLEEEFRSYNML